MDQRYDMVKDRETKIQKIEVINKHIFFNFFFSNLFIIKSDILDINSIMRDLSSLVVEQSSLIGNISYIFF